MTPTSLFSSRPRGAAVSATALPRVQLFARLLLVTVFVFSAVDKTLHFDAAIGEMQAFGLPVPALTAALVIAVQAGGPVLLLPATAPVGAALLAVFTLAATLLA